MTINDSLKKLDLKDKEIQVYLACLEIGESQIVPITQRVALPRTTVFHILEKLGQIKLIEIIQKGSRRLYVPYPPKRIATLLKQKGHEIDEQIKTAEEIIPQLSSIYSSSSFQPKIRIFKNEEIRQIYEEILESPTDEVWYVGEMKTIRDVMGEKYLDNYIKRRVAMGQKSKSIRVKSAEPDKFLYLGTHDFLRTYRYAPTDFKCPSHILIYGRNVGVLTSGKEAFGLVITSQELSESMRNWFRQLWKISK